MISAPYLPPQIYTGAMSWVTLMSFLPRKPKMVRFWCLMAQDLPRLPFLKKVTRIWASFCRGILKRLMVFLPHGAPISGFIDLGIQVGVKYRKAKYNSWAPSWGLYERGSRDILSPDRALLKVISKNALSLRQYRISDGYPTDMLPSLAGQWHQVADSGEIVGWRGFQSRYLFSAEDHEKVEERTPQFVRIAPNSDTPEVIADLRPLILIHDENSISYQYSFAAIAKTDRLYFLHEDGFAYYSNGKVKRLPAEWLDSVGKLPHFVTTNHALYIAAGNGFFLVGEDDTLTHVVAPQSQAGFGVDHNAFELECEGYGVGFFGSKTGIYSFDLNGMVTLIEQFPAPVKPYGVMPDGKSGLFSERDGHLKLLSAEC